jgi:hypothetical protein
MPRFSNFTLSIGVWNIDSLHTLFLQVHEMLNSLDIFCLSETHCNLLDDVDLDGFHIVHNLRPKSPKAPRAFGGLAVGIKLALVKGVTFLKPTHTEFMWFKLNKSFFGFNSDLYICSLYISPARSSFSHQRDDIFTLIEEDIVKFNAMGDCIIMGDFNAKTSKQTDFIVNDSNFNNFVDGYSDLLMNLFPDKIWILIVLIVMVKPF